VRTRVLLLLTGAALLVRSAAGLWSPAAVVLDPLLVVNVLAALPGRAQRALGAALLTGLLADAWSGRWFGEIAFVHLVIAFVLSRLAASVDLLQPAPMALVLAAATAASWGLQVALSLAFDHNVGQMPGPGTWIAAIVINALLGLFARRLIQRLGGFER